MWLNEKISWLNVTTSAPLMMNKWANPKTYVTF